ncbi:UNVERIFIED_ORG: transposase IS204/IS1001/IS1096/IS1165 family protein [Dietzia maris]|uniref:transposase n=1 Tax=Dietzia maris TaxID=37915 RepID=UPI0010DEDD4E
MLELATDEETAAACPSCGVFSSSVKERVTTRPRDIPYGEHRVLLRCNKIRWRCLEDYCERGSFTESIEQIPARTRTTRRLRTQIGAAIGDAARSVVEVATAHGVSWPTAHRAFVEHAQQLLAEPEPVRALGIDETRRSKPWCVDSNIPELLAVAKTVDVWWPEISAFVRTGITNARTEGYNRLVKAVKRSACGFRNRENSARRIRFHCTRIQRAAPQTSY